MVSSLLAALTNMVLATARLVACCHLGLSWPWKQYSNDSIPSHHLYHCRSVRPTLCSFTDLMLVGLSFNSNSGLTWLLPSLSLQNPVLQCNSPGNPNVLGVDFCSDWQCLPSCPSGSTEVRLWPADGFFRQFCHVHSSTPLPMLRPVNSGMEA